MRVEWQATITLFILQELDLLEYRPAARNADSRRSAERPNQLEANESAAATSAEAAASPQSSQEPPASSHAQADLDRRVAPRIHSQSSPQNPAALQQLSEVAPTTATADIEPSTGHADALDNQVNPQDRASELRSHPLVPTPSRKRSFDPLEASTSLTNSPTAAATAAEQFPQQSNVEHIHESVRGSNQQRPGGLLAPVTWAARGAGRLVGSILRRSSSDRR